MKKTSFLGYALTLALAIVAGSAMGQDVAGGTNYVKVGNDGDEANKVSLIQVGMPFGFYVAVDAAYHPNYNGTGSWKVSPGFNWTWTATGLDQSGKVDNYVELKASTAGKYTVSVQENVPTALGTCTPDPVTFDVIAFDAPSFSFDDADDDVVCGDKNDHPFKTLTIKSSGTPWVKYKVEKHKVSINAADGTKTVGDEIGTATSVTEKFTTSWSYDQSAATQNGTNTSIELKTALNTETPALAIYNFVYTAPTLAAPSATDAEPMFCYRLVIEGVNGLISRKADYTQKTGVAPVEFKFYPETLSNNQVDVFVAKTPKTGPVYHIGNNVAI